MATVADYRKQNRVSSPHLGSFSLLRLHFVDCLRMFHRLLHVQVLTSDPEYVGKC